MKHINEMVTEVFSLDPDGISFSPSKDESEFLIKGVEYSKKSKYEVYDLGHMYHILVYKSDIDGRIINTDLFSGILIDPKVYVSGLIRNGFYGFVLKKTKSSPKFVKELYKKLLDSIKYYGKEATES